MQHIKNIEIKNFKSIRHQIIDDCRRINVFIGYPNVGKSNILEALGLFQIDRLGDVDFRNVLRFETYNNLFFNNNTLETIEVSVSPTEGIKLRIDKNNELFVRSESSSMYFEMEIPLTNFKIKSMEHVSSASEGYDSLERLQIKSYIFNTNLHKEPFSGFAHKYLDNPHGENLAEIIKFNPELRKDVVQIFREYNLKYATDENNNLRIVKEFKDGEVKIFPYIQIADTIQRLIFFKAAIKSNTESVLLFEEPEAHMFPPYISKLTSDIIYDENKNQYFITTHSPFVLNDFVEDVDKEELSVYVVGYKKDTGETIVRRITDEEKEEIYQYGVDLFFNLENYLKDAV